MKIGVLEWDVSALGGRQRTMLAFADFFVELGHEVTVYTDFYNPAPATGWTAKSFLNWFPFQSLRYDHFQWCGLTREKWTVPESMKQLDVLLVSYGGWGYLQGQLPDTRVIAWVIHPAQRRHDCCREYWTNSETTRRRLRASSRWMRAKPHVIRPPHDYSMFRSCNRPPDQRIIDVAIVGSALWAKGLVKAAALIRKQGLRAVTLASCWKAAEGENQAVIEGVLRAQAGSKQEVVLLTNQPVAAVAPLLGMSKVYLSMSDAESCSLSIYEALSAGCIVVARKVGAAMEQLQGGFGHAVFNRDAGAGRALVQALADGKTNAEWLRRKAPTWFDRGDPEVRRAIELALEGK